MNEITLSFPDHERIPLKDYAGRVRVPGNRTDIRMRKDSVSAGFNEEMILVDMQGTRIAPR